MRPRQEIVSLDTDADIQTCFEVARRSRGARRIVTGSRGERYYSADHYETFHRIVAG